MNLQKYLLSIITLVLGMGLLSGCAFGMVIGSGKSVTETRAVSDFHAVDFAFLGDLEITQGDAETLTITGDDNIVALIRTTVRDGVLHIDAGAANIGRTIVPLRYVLTVKELDSIALSGLGNVSMPSLTSDDVVLALSGAGSLTIDAVTADDVAVSLSGLGSANLSGEVNRQVVNLSGAGSYYADDLRTQTADVSISGLGSAEVWAVETLNAAISGAGNIEYKGNPQVTQQISGLGRITSASSD